MRTARWALAILATSACGRMAEPTPPTTLTDADAHLIGVEVPPFVYQMLAVFQQDGVAPPIFVRGLEAVSPLRSDTVVGPAGCPAHLSGLVDTAGRPIDSDGDGIPDSVTMTYAPGTCHLPVGVGDETESFVGMVQVRDVPGPYAFAWQGDFTDSLDRGPGNYTSRHTKGTEYAALESDHMTLDADFTITVAFAHDGITGTAAYHDTWSAQFLPDSGTVLVPRVTTPSGNIVFAGTFSLSEPTHGRAGDFRLFTSVPIHYSAACDAALLYPAFTSGQVTGALASDTAAGFTVNFNACYTAPVIVGKGNAN